MRQDEKSKPNFDPSQGSLPLGAEERRLLEDAMRLLPETSPQDVMRLALYELVEHRRFLAWVDENDREGKRAASPTTLPVAYARGFGA